MIRVVNWWITVNYRNENEKEMTAAKKRILKVDLFGISLSAGVRQGYMQMLMQMRAYANEY